MQELVSVIITTYCRPVQMFLRALDSVRNQTYQNLEIIIVDDSPVDYFERESIKQAILDFKDNRIRYIAHEQNRGACAARNTGLAAANGKYIAFLDDDDEWLKDKISEQVSVLEASDEDTALVYCNSYCVNDSSGKKRKMERKLVSGYVYESLILSNFISSTSYPLMKTEALRQVGGFDTMMKSAQDCDVWLRIAKKFKVTYTEKALVIYHIHNGERISGDPRKRIAGLERINEKNIDYLKKNKEAYWSRTIRIAPYYAANNQLGKALETWFCAVLRKPFRLKNLMYLYSIYRNWTNEKKEQCPEESE